jgi:hypothetical protein
VGCYIKKEKRTYQYGDGSNEFSERNVTWCLTEPAARPDSRKTSHKVLTPQAKQAVKVVIGWNVYFQAVWVLKVCRPVAAFLRFVTVQRV